MDTDVILKRFETPEDVRVLVLGRFVIVSLAVLTFGRAPATDINPDEAVAVGGGLASLLAGYADAPRDGARPRRN